MRYLILIFFLINLISCENKSKKVQKEIQSLNTNEAKIDSTSIQNESSKHETFNKIIDSINEELKFFIPKGYSVINQSTGDANLDGITDKILILKKVGEESTSKYNEGKQEKRPLLLFLGKTDNTYKLAIRNDNAVYCIDCGGIFGDPFVGSAIKNGYFSIEHGIAGGQHWEQVITFKYDKKHNNWFLYKDHFINYRMNESNDPETDALVVDVDKLETEKEFGKISIEKFNIYNEDRN